MKKVSPVWTVTLVGALLSTITIGDCLHGDEPAQDAGTKQVKVRDITLVVPAAWKSQPPSNNLRLAQFEIPAVGGDQEPAELSVFNFGGGATVEQQIDRWKGQFLPEKRVFSKEQGKIALGEYVLVDLSGTYKKSIGPPVLRKTVAVPGSRMMIAMIGTAKGTYFVKLVGLQATVSAAATDFRKSIGAPEKKPAEAEE